uniref:Uncharacterized protein n=1 Tax=Salix viminalis TaxID=40686 RepID=A0A6N2KZJ7_SALVM
MTKRKCLPSNQTLTPAYFFPVLFLFKPNPSQLTQRHPFSLLNSPSHRTLKSPREFPSSSPELSLPVPELVHNRKRQAMSSGQSQQF